jgi:ferric-dicitrate binding protein FerR (iron transport regulator)
VSLKVQEQDEKLVARLSEAARDAAGADAAGPAPEAWHRLQRARERDRDRERSVRRWGQPALVAAGLALVVAGVLARRPRPLTYVVNGGQAEANGYVTRAGAAPTELRFSEGTRVRLARGARMSVAATGPHGARLRVEDGQAHFEVSHLPGADWSVEAGPYRVQVTGTVFDVRWSGGEEVTVALAVGSVRVTGPNLAAPVTLAPGQRLVARLATAEVRLEAGGVEAVDAAGSSTDATPRDAEAEAVPPSAANAEPSSKPKAEASRAAPAAEREPTAPREAPSPARAARPAARVSQAAFAPAGWAGRVAAGDSAGVLAEARAQVFDDVIGRVDVHELVALADAARFAGQPALCERTLTELRRRFAASAEARAAAFQLGRLDDDAGDARGALAWYRRYAEEAPRGPYAAEAFGREMLDVERLEGPAAAAPLARRYLDRFPEGTYLLQARAILGLP